MMTPMGRVASTEEFLEFFTQLRYDAGNPLERFLINRRRRKEGRPRLRPSP